MPDNIDSLLFLKHLVKLVGEAVKWFLKQVKYRN